VATEASKQGEGDPSTGSKVAAISFVALILVGGYFLVCGLVPADLPPDKNANFIDSIFHNKGVVLAARLLLVSAAVVLAMGGVYIVVSMGIRMANGQWLKRAGPIEIGEKEIGAIETEIANWKKAAEAGEEEIEELTRRLKASDELIEELEQDIEKLHLDMDDG
jgi:septal ring factor EnvC (AmiA/AmiB activator)